MNIRIATIMSALCLPLCATAQQREPLPAPEGQERPEEIEVIGQRRIFELRIHMLDAEEVAYGVFNQFNDEPRFDISCSTQLRANSHMQSGVLHCQPEFERAALAGHGQDYFEGLRDYLNQLSNPEVLRAQGGGADPLQRVAPTNVAAEALIAAQQKAYRLKMKQVAEEHPEFLEALIRYSEAKERYEDATGRDRE